MLRLHDADYQKLVGPNVGFTEDLGRLMLEETRLFIDEVTWQGAGDFRALLTSPVSFLNGPLAAFYGVPGVSGDAFVKVSLDPKRRGGVLTQPSLLARTSSGPTTSPTRRGMTVLDLLCKPLQTPPPTAVVVLTDSPPGLTTRERLTMVTSDATCASCHRLSDSVGFAFEHYDAVGRWRDADNGRPVDAAGELVVGDVTGPLNGASGAIDVGTMLARSQDARSCYVGNWMAFAYGRREVAADACTRQSLMETFTRTDGSIRELLVALTQTEAFLTRPLTPKQ